MKFASLCMWRRVHEAEFNQSKWLVLRAALRQWQRWLHAHVALRVALEEGLARAAAHDEQRIRVGMLHWWSWQVAWYKANLEASSQLVFEQRDARERTRRIRRQEMGPNAEESTLLEAALAVWRALCARRAHFLQRSSREAVKRCHALAILLMDHWVDLALPPSRAEVLRRRRHARIDLASKQQRPASAPAALDQQNRRTVALAHSGFHSSSLHSTPSRSSPNSTPSYTTPNSTPSPTPGLKQGPHRRTVAAASVTAHQHDTPGARSNVTSLARRAGKREPPSNELQSESPCSEELATGMQVPTPPLVESFSFSDLTPEAATECAATEEAKASVGSAASCDGTFTQASSPQRVRAAIKSAQGLVGSLTKSPLQSSKLSANSGAPAVKPLAPSPSVVSMPRSCEGTGGTATPDGSSPRLPCDSTHGAERKVATSTPSPGNLKGSRPSGIPLVLLPTPLSRRSRTLPRAHKLSQEIPATSVPPKRPEPAHPSTFLGCENLPGGFEGEHMEDNSGANAGAAVGKQEFLSAGTGSGGDILRFFKLRQAPVT